MDWNEYKKLTKIEKLKLSKRTYRTVEKDGQVEIHLTDYQVFDMSICGQLALIALRYPNRKATRTDYGWLLK
jgi:hypothetical protein